MDALLHSITTKRERALARKNYRIYLPRDSTIRKKSYKDFTTEESGSN